MFCRQCGAQVASNEKFCPKCGTAVIMNEAPVQTNVSDPSFVSNGSTVYPNSNGSPAKPKKRHTKPIIAGIAVLVAAAVGVTVTVNLVMKKPLAAFAVGLEHLSGEMTEIESCHMEISAKSDENVDGSFDMEVNADSQEMYLYGILEAMGEEMQFAVCIEGNRGNYALESNGMVFSEEISGVQLDAMWEAHDTQDFDDVSLEEYIKDLDISDEVEEYFDLDQIDDAYENIIRRISKRSTQKDLEEALAIEKDSKSGEKIYTITLSDDTIIDTAELCLDILEEEAEDAIRGDWVDEARSELKEETKDSDEYGELEWRLKNGNLTSLSITSTYETDFDLTMDCAYQDDDLDEIGLSMEYEDGFEEFFIEITLNEFNQVEDVKGMIPDNMMDEIESSSIM